MNITMVSISNEASFIACDFTRCRVFLVISAYLHFFVDEIFRAVNEEFDILII